MENGQSPIITIEHLSKKYGDVEVLKDINPEIPRGEIYGLIGRSGAGKSTLLRCINGLETFQNGSLYVDGSNVKNIRNKELRQFRKNIGMIFQHFSLLNRLTAAENIAFPLKIWNYPTKEIEQKVEELLKLVGLEKKKNAYPSKLSGGQKQRVAIARALAMDPKILLCDEATSALDPKTSEEIINFRLEINERLSITIIVVTHQMSILRSCCRKITILEDGMNAETGDIKEIFTNQSAPLLRLIGNKKRFLPEYGANIKLILSDENCKFPLITDIGRLLQIDIRLVSGETERFRDGFFSTIIINIDRENFYLVTEYLNKRNISWKYLDKEVFQ